MSAIETKFTKGPWRQVAVDGGWDGVAEAVNPNSTICKLVLNVDANAALIAAAPDLYEALATMLAEKIDYMVRNQLGNPFAEGTSKMALAALASARGEKS